MPTPKQPRPKKPLRTSPASSQSSRAAFNSAIEDLRKPNSAFPDVSPRWLLSAGAVVLLGAAVFGWLTLCLLYWQGSWQLLYHPKATITLTPASVGLPYQTIHFAATETGQTQLTGWYLPADPAKPTILYLHGAVGNLSDTVDSLANLHRQNVPIFAIDYRGYGPAYGSSQFQGKPTRPSEKQLRQDAEWALTYLTLTRHIAPKQIVVYGTLLGANVALELAADHPELAGAILDRPLTDPLAPLFQDSRSRLVPAHALVQDKYDLGKAAKGVQIPSLWLTSLPEDHTPATAPPAYQDLNAGKTIAFLQSPIQSDPNYQSELNRWLDDLTAK